MNARHMQIKNLQQIIVVSQQCAFPSLAYKLARPTEWKYADKQDKDIQKIE